MASSTGYLLGKVQLVGAIDSEVLTSLVSTFLQTYQAPTFAKNQVKFQLGIKYSINCSDCGLKLTAPGFRSCDEGFESDTESIRSVKLQEMGELELIELMKGLDIAHVTESRHSTSLPSTSSVPSSDITRSAMNIQAFLDDSNSSSGNGSDSDEFSSPTGSSERSSQSWEILPNLPTFQSYLLQDVLFCHVDTLYPSTLVWVVRNQSNMIALVTFFLSRSDAMHLFRRYCQVRLKANPPKVKIYQNTVSGTKLMLPPLPMAPPPPLPPPRTCSVLSSTNNYDDQTYLSLPSIFPTEVVPEINSKPQVSSIVDFKSMNCLQDTRQIKPETVKFTDMTVESTINSSGTIPRHVNTMSFPRRFLFTPESKGIETNKYRNERNDPDLDSECDDDDTEECEVRMRAQYRPKKSVQLEKVKGGKHLMLVPLKNESISAPGRTNYPKESYLYKVMCRTSSTFAPYQRSLNFVTPHGNNCGTDYFTCPSSNNAQLPFSAWTEISEFSNQQGAMSIPIKSQRQVPMTQKSIRRRISKTSTLSHLTGKGTAKILLRDIDPYPPGIWTNLSQRVKQNFRVNLMSKLNGMWTQPGDSGNNKVKKQFNKKVTFCAWATVQIL